MTKTEKIQIEFFCHLAGSFSPFMFQHRGERDVVPTILEVPIVIHWKGALLNDQGILSRKECLMGCLEITIEECVGNFHIFKKIDETKLTNWIVHELEKVPEDKRNQDWVQGVSLDTIKLWLK